jgi:hypothetical protein
VAGAIAQQVRQPLTAIVASAHAIQRWLGGPGALPENVAVALDRIVKASHQADEMIAKFLRDLSFGLPTKDTEQ